ncbi:hypothetical protein VST63_08485 [Mycolicibacterium sp. 050232]|uniref:hypothetical protein n=1 Tax=Mycolicibacterium sp. 050232 TaxID=3113982 RepID=UPI002E2C9F22|nr:hypothetical protein [Mycolicibacterium sp. 050232]MED5812396.1 hypothetical protein [Mycolicibacterium sp. 050232]
MPIASTPHGRQGRSVGVITTADQVLSSASNALMVFAVAQVSPAEQFGIVALLVTVATTWIGFNRGALGTALLLTSNMHRREIAAEGGYATSWSLVTSVVAGAALLVLSYVFGQFWIGVAFAVSMVAVLAQDVLRFVAIAQARPLVAAICDGLWVAWILAIYLVNLVSSGMSAVASVYLWGAGGLISALLLAAVLRIKPRAYRLVGWWRRYDRARLSFGTVYALNQVGATLVTLTVTVVVSGTAAAGLRGGATLFGPIAMLVSALPMVFVPHARRAASSPGEQWRVLVKTSTLTSGLTAVAGVILAVIPSQLGSAVLGDTWAYASALVVYLGIECAAMCWMVSVYAFFQAQGMSRTVLRVKLFQICLQLGLCLCAGLVVGTAVAVAVSLAVSGIVSALVGVVLAVRVVRPAATAREENVIGVAQRTHTQHGDPIESEKPLGETGIAWPKVDVLEAEMRGRRAYE